jgi:N-acetylmuramoyl-L-alanine amidase
MSLEIRSQMPRRGHGHTAWRALLAGLVLLGLPLAAAAQDATAIAAHVTGDAGRSILTIELSKPVTYKVFALDKPYRVVIDLPAIEFQLPKGTGSDGAGTELVPDFRYGLIGPGRSRIVVDTSGPFIVESAGILSKAGEGGAQFKIAMAATDAATFAARMPHRLVKVKPAAPPAETSFVPKPLIVIDPGHGGPDSGAVSPDGAEEKNMVLAIGKKVQEQLEAAGKFKVLMTRDTDVFVTLKGRVDFAEEHNADLMVSIHADSTNNSRHWQPVGGATVYTRSETASDEEARVVAMKENMSDLVAGEALPPDEGNAVSNIGLDLARTETKALDQVLAEQAVKRLARVTPMTAESHREARFYVLKSPKVPAMLVETGYVNNRQDSSRLQSAGWQDKLAAAIVSAIDAYFAERDKGLTTLLGLSAPDPVQ